MSNQHRINNSTLTDFGNIARAKTGETRLFTIEEIKTIFRLGSGDDSAIAELKALVTPKLPNMHFDKMNLIQFKWVYIWIIQEIADLPAHFTIDLTESATEVDENGNLVLYDNGMPVVELISVRVYDRQQIVKEAQDDYREQFDAALEEIVTEFELDVTLTETEDLADTLSNLSAVCEALASGGGEISADNISVPFSYTENGVTTNLEFTVIDGNPVIKEMEE